MVVEVGKRGLRKVQSGVESAGKAARGAAKVVGDTAKTVGERTGVTDAASKIGDVAVAGAEAAAKGVHDGARHVVRRASRIPRAIDEDEAKAASVCFVEELPDDVMKSYFGVLVWLVHGDDRRIDQGEMCEIQLLMAQRRCSADVRAAARKHFENPPGETDTRFRIQHIVDSTENVKTSGKASQAMRFGLMKDAIRVQRATRATSDDAIVRGQPGIQKLAEMLELDDRQVKVIEDGCSHEESILAGNLSDPNFAIVAKEWAASAAGVGVPVAVVYGAGVSGLSAVGITSGLATLGMGGLLGLSAMLTGIGVVIIGGGVTYKGVKWVLGKSRRDRASIRELMLQEVLRIHQVAIVNLGEDLAAFGARIADLASQTERNRDAIDWLSHEVALLSQSASALSRLRADANRFEHDLQEVQSQG